MAHPLLITLTSDFGVQTQGVGTMEAVVFEISPQSKIIHLMHGLPEFDVIAAARTMETVRYIPVGFHVCVCDPGVGTKRKGIALEVDRGDVFIGPNKGIFMPAARLLGGIRRVYELTNPKYHHHPVSSIFHGRDIFAPAAAHLANGISITDFGDEVDPGELIPAPYEDAKKQGNLFCARIIQLNRFGSLHLNILHEQWDEVAPAYGQSLDLRLASGEIVKVTHARTFGDVAEGGDIIMKDDYGRVEVAKNLGSFIKEHPAKAGDDVVLYLSGR